MSLLPFSIQFLFFYSYRRMPGHWLSPNILRFGNDALDNYSIASDSSTSWLLRHALEWEFRCFTTRTKAKNIAQILTISRKSVAVKNCRLPFNYERFVGSKKNVNYGKRIVVKVTQVLFCLQDTQSVKTTKLKKPHPQKESTCHSDTSRSAT